MSPFDIFPVCAIFRMNGRKETLLVKPEYILIGVLLLIGAVAVPAMTDVYLVQSFVLSLCTGLGIR